MTCELCGCTDFAACQTPEGPCHWVAANLCSACATVEDVQAAQDKPQKANGKRPGIPENLAGLDRG